MFGPDFIKQLPQQVKAATGRRPTQKDLLALAPDNDPFLAGRDSHWRDARWFAELFIAEGFPRGVHLRRVHYRLMSRGNVIKPDGSAYANEDVADWGLLQTAGKFARHLGLVDPLAFDDRRNPPPVIYIHPEPTPAPMVSVEPYCSMSLPTLQAALELPSWSLPEPEVLGYSYSPSDQPYLLEAWFEKSTQNDVLLPLARELGFNLVTGIGFLSITACVQFLLRVKAARKPARVFYGSDFDPAGDDMCAAVARQIEYYRQVLGTEQEIKVTPLVLTPEQVELYDLPRAPIKETDRRKGNFEGRHGTGAVELDALEALHPGELEKLTRRAMAPYLDKSLLHRLIDAEREADERADEAWGEAIAEAEADMGEIRRDAAAAIKPYRQRLTDLGREVEEDLEPIRERLVRLREHVEAVAEDFDVDLPARPLAEARPPDESGWLFDSGREYLEQLRHYKARK